MIVNKRENKSEKKKQKKTWNMLIEIRCCLTS